MHVVIIGNGIAGINVASALSSAEGVSVEVFGAETSPFYSRVRLPEVLSGTATEESIVFYKTEWYEKKKIQVHCAVKVVSVDREEKKIVLDTGETRLYDYLVLATGSFANKPSIPGVDLPGIFTLRTIDDVSSIRRRIASRSSTASVIGGGLLGLEAARALKDAGVQKVRVLEQYPTLLSRQLDETGGFLLRKHLEAMGLEILCGVTTVRLEDGAIALKDGRSIESDTTILSMGVRPNAELAKASGLTVNRGIVVDNHLRTNDPFIYAVGDCAEFDGVVWGIIPAALEQAPVAARSILASASIIPSEQSTAYSQTVPKTALKVGGIEMMSLGKVALCLEERDSGKYEIVSKVWDDIDRYEKFVLEDREGSSVLVGSILYGSKLHQSRVQKMIGQIISRAEINGLLAE